RKVLQCYMGIGVKVADCILLYSGTRYDVFPSDVWIKKIMASYLGESPSVEKILKYASEVFGRYAGIAQQYLFHYARFNL
ncbi:MAG TPA: 8-oxoguanine DNA glycosylase, partial [Clostridiales bacterium]|nr:8-oxoguanine DNA glycosylase [Clostridiales bacterium]